MKRFKLTQTCSACPESYDVYFDDVYIGYLHLRCGYFSAIFYNRETDEHENVYSSNPYGDGCFENEDEKIKELNAGCHALFVAHTQISYKPDDLTPTYKIT